MLFIIHNIQHSTYSKRVLLALIQHQLSTTIMSVQLTTQSVGNNSASQRPSEPSLCIPRVFMNINEARIRRVFGELGLGDIKKLVVIPIKSDKGPKFNRIFVHFERWNTSEAATAVRDRLLSGKEIKIIYDEPWFWKVSAYRPLPPNRATNARQQRQPKRATIQLDCDDSVTREHAHVPPQKRTSDDVRNIDRSSPSRPTTTTKTHEQEEKEEEKEEGEC